MTEADVARREDGDAVTRADRTDFFLQIEDQELGFLIPVQIDAVEGISRIFEARVRALRKRVDDTADPSLRDLVGKPALLRVNFGTGERHFPVLVQSIRAAGERKGYRVYDLVLVSPMWLLTQRSQNRVFQAMKTHEIVAHVMETAGIDPEDIVISVDNDHKPRDLCIQYGVSDYEFISQLMEEEGLFWFQSFRTDDDDAVPDDDGEPWRYVISDQQMIHTALPENDTVVYRPPSSAGTTDQFVRELAFSRRLRPGSALVRDYDHRDSNADNSNLGMSTFHGTEAFDAIDMEADLGLYRWPGGYEVRDVPASDGDTPDDRAATGLDPTDPKDLFESALMGDLSLIDVEAARSDAVVLDGESDLRILRAGYLVNITEHPDDSFNGEMLITSVTHHCRQAPADAPELGTDVARSYSNEFTAMPSEVQFRAPQITPKPHIGGVQVARVVGASADDDIHVDNMGRIKVRFPWAEQRADDDTACAWVRVAQAWAGPGYGHMVIPRVGWEVLVQFIAGDPNRPVVIGCLYNDANTPSYTLPDDKTRMVIKSRSSPYGDGFNELSFEDKDGEEQVYIHAQKNMDVDVGTNASRTVGNDDTLTVGHDRTMNVANDLEETIDHEYTLNCPTMNINGTSGSGNITVDSGEIITLKVGASSMVMDGSSITLTSTTITLDATDVVVNGSASICETTPDFYAGDGGNGFAAVGATIDVTGSAITLAGGTVDATGSAITLAGGTVSATGTAFSADVSGEAKLKGGTVAIEGGSVAVKGGSITLN